MKDDDALPTMTTPNCKKESSDSSLFGKGRYKFWAFAAILLLAFWSMLTGTVTLRWSAGNLNRLSDDLDNPIRDDLDVLEMEEREKVVKHMWDVYTNSRRIRLPRFWEEAFNAAYEDLTSDAPGVRQAAITEIAKMSVRSVHLDPPPVQSTEVYKKCWKFTEKLYHQFEILRYKMQNESQRITTARELSKSLKRAKNGREM